MTQMTVREYVVVTKAPKSGDVSSVFGPMTYEEAHALNDAIWRHYGEPSVGGVHLMATALRLDERFFIGVLCVYGGVNPQALEAR